MEAYGVSATRSRRRTFTSTSGGSVEGLGIEIRQAIQNLAHAVRLNAGKRTVIRAFLSPKGLVRNVRVRGELAGAERAVAPEQYLTSVNIVSLKADHHPALAEQNSNVDQSLNFEIPTPAPRLG